MSPGVNLMHRAPVLCTLLVAGFLSACGGGSSASAATTTVPQPIAGDVERTQFAPALNVHLDQMVKRASGLYVQDLTTGTGRFASRGSTAVLRYTGWRADGKQFDDGEITMTLGKAQTIAAWEEGVLGMRVGGKRRLVVPPNLGYGARGAGDDIPPNTVLVFDITLQSVYDK
jgi:FKBP-type peptidyl-prolyl cis-trans isomerase FkpA